MVLRKITVDNSVRFVPIRGKTKETDIKPKKIKAGSIPRKQNQKTFAKQQKLLENVAASGLGILKRIIIC